MKKVSWDDIMAAFTAVSHHLDLPISSEVVARFIFYDKPIEWGTLPDEVADRIQALAGPHSHAICKAIEARRVKIN